MISLPYLEVAKMILSYHLFKFSLVITLLLLFQNVGIYNLIMKRTPPPPPTNKRKVPQTPKAAPPKTIID